jgi:hypothetical protein
MQGLFKKNPALAKQKRGNHIVTFYIDVPKLHMLDSSEIKLYKKLSKVI